MRKPEKPGTEAARTREGGGLGNIDEATGHPGKGTPGATVRQEDNPSSTPSKNPPAGKPKDGNPKP